MTIDRQRLQDIIEAFSAGAALGDEEREYAARLLTMVNQLAFYGDDLERRYEYQQRKGSERIRQVMNDMTLLGIAHRSGKGMDEARRLIQAKRENRNKLVAMVDFVRAVKGITQTAAQIEVASILRLNHDNVRSIYARHKRKANPKG